MPDPIAYNELLTRLSVFDPVTYASSRNFINGQVSKLSPYISRGVINPKQVYHHLRNRYDTAQCSSFLRELLWREYFQRVQQQQPFIHLHPPREDQGDVEGIPDAFIRADTGITAIDDGIRTLYTEGYMHNHLRMYVASIAHLAGYRYTRPASWMYYHLLDGDVASNYISWQWVYGLSTGKKYVANQENINRFCATEQKHTFLDITYGQLQSDIKLTLPAAQPAPSYSTILPALNMPQLNERPVLLYNSYNLDPLWYRNEAMNRILLLEPSHFLKYPVSGKVLTFILELASSISGIQIFSGEYADLVNKFPSHQFITREHPLFTYQGATIEPREWLAEKVTDYYPSFSKFYAAVKKQYEEYFR